VRRRLSYLAVAAALGVGVAVLPALAASESLPVEAVNEGLYYHHWSNPLQTVIAGDTVKFANPSNEVPHGLKFTSGPGTPGCTGIPAAAAEEAGATKWQGECAFSTPGTYAFVCTVHPGEMKGTITVNPNGITTTTTSTTTTPTTTGTAPSETPPGSPLAGGPSIRSNQHGGVVKGALEVSQAGAGDRLEIDLLAARVSLATARRAARVTVGRFTVASVKAGRLPFSIRLSAKARRALHRRRHLALTVSILLTPSHGRPTTVTRSVVEHS
jgi:plastocyanin